jgi:hypothetical protein
MNSYVAYVSRRVLNSRYTKFGWNKQTIILDRKLSLCIYTTVYIILSIISFRVPQCMDILDIAPKFLIMAVFVIFTE